jgi:hypothetical protein
MAICRVYLLTYRRQQLLPRALNSLLQQTFTDWVCELHNDDPTDFFPQQLVEQLGDRRITVINHAQNLGGTRSFNLAFQAIAEPYISLLEDDNWWEPTFLETMVTTMQRFPQVQVAWANMQIWQEAADSWINTGQTIWQRDLHDPPELLNWGHPQQILGALHSNGTLVVRSTLADHYIVPEQTPLAATEPIRERAFPFPVLFIPQVHANFAVTRTTARSNHHVSWAQSQILLAGSYFKYVSPSHEQLRAVWKTARSKPAKSTATLFLAALSCPGCLYLLRSATIADWCFFGLFCIKHPFVAMQALRSIATFPEVWRFLDQHTAIRVQEQAVREQTTQEQTMQEQTMQEPLEPGGDRAWQLS